MVQFHRGFHVGLAIILLGASTVLGRPVDIGARTISERSLDLDGVDVGLYARNPTAKKPKLEVGTSAQDAHTDPLRRLADKPTPAPPPSPIDPSTNTATSNDIDEYFIHLYNLGRRPVANPDKRKRE